MAPYAAALLHATLLLALAGSDGRIGVLEALVVTSWIVMGLVDHHLRGPSTGGAHWTSSVIGAGWLGLTVSALTTAGAGRTWPLLLIALGLAMRAAAVRRLGPRYGDGLTPLGPRETGGIYRFLRHPGELGMLLVASGSALTLGSVWALGCVAGVIIPASLWRMSGEERALSRLDPRDRRVPANGSASPFVAS